MKNRIYLDHAATTAVHPDVLAEMLPYFGEVGHNPSSLHAEGRRARAGLDAARDRVAAALGVARKEITFVGSGSEADNQAILSAARTYRKRGRHVVSTANRTSRGLAYARCLARRRLRDHAAPGR